MVNLYSLEPASKRRPTLEAAESEEHLYHNLLSEILSIVRITRDVPAIGNDPSLIAQDQLLKSSKITFRGFPRLLHKLFVRIAKPFLRGAVHKESASHTHPASSKRDSQVISPGNERA
jgi:hypothetical protein